MAHVHSVLVAMMLVAANAAAQSPKTFCNPLNLDYGISVKKEIAYRHGADPVIVLFGDRYYLFSTWDRPGYLVSDDLVEWKFIPFAGPAELVGHSYTAAAVEIIDGFMYYTELSRTPTGLLR